MSYPRKLHILIVEDDSDTVDAYRQYFTVLKKKYPLVEPFIVRSFSDAKQRIDGTEIFHIVILDLNLPIQTRGHLDEGVAPGEQLLEMIAKRDSHPVPALLVVSGKLNLTQPIGNLPKRLDSDFWYGRMVNKGGLTEHQEFESAIIETYRYLDVGIHIQDAGKEWFPTLSPREQDLLRRCVLGQSSTFGVDIRWWSAEPGQSISHPSPNRGPTKVLMGHSLLDDGMGCSLPTFFKFEPAGNGPSVCRNVSILGQKLAHVKSFSTVFSRQRCLIVTQSVTKGIPISLNEYLQRDPVMVSAHISQLVGHIVEQLNQLGDANDDEVPVPSFLWKHLDRDAIEKAWKKIDERQRLSQGGSDPVATFDFLKSATIRMWAIRRACTHGDLNATNVAIDASLPSNPQAYIFDAGWMEPDFEYRDLATLEVTTILFNAAGIDDQLIHASKVYYDAEFLPLSVQANPSVSPLVQNVLSTIAAIRSGMLSEQQKKAYALLVFSAVMQQLSGLGIQSSPNKVSNPLHACYLAAWVSNWVKKVVPDLFPQGSMSLVLDDPPSMEPREHA